jgi:tetratricopeptide (TPR) repeat protein
VGWFLIASALLTGAWAAPRQSSSEPPSSQSSAPSGKKLQTRPNAPEEEEPPEEDPSLKPKEYALNPLEAERNVTAGNFYFRKGNFRAAAKRYLEATRWNPADAEAFLKLGESDEKIHDFPVAREAYSKYVQLAPDAKNAPEIKKKIAKWPDPQASK